MEKICKEVDFSSPGITNITNIDCDTLKGISISSQGIHGVIFLENKDGIFILKSSQHFASEYFCFLLFRELGIRTPEMRLSQFSDN